MFAQLGETWFDDYWMNYGAITIQKNDGKTKKIASLEEFVSYRGGDLRLIVRKPPKSANRKKLS